NTSCAGALAGAGAGWFCALATGARATNRTNASDCARNFDIATPSVRPSRSRTWRIGAALTAALLLSQPMKLGSTDRVGQRSNIVFGSINEATVAAAVKAVAMDCCVPKGQPDRTGQSKVCGRCY